MFLPLALKSLIIRRNNDTLIKLMKTNCSIPLKAMFLLVVFLLNTVIGFACSVGLEEDHHHHGLAANHHSPKKHKENCCKDEVTKLVKEDKLVDSKGAVNLKPMVYFIVPTSFYHFDALALAITAPSTRYFVRSYHPPIEDIRISIQSFQI